MIYQIASVLAFRIDVLWTRRTAEEINIGYSEAASMKEQHVNRV
jgi:hypothetical protein